VEAHAVAAKLIMPKWTLRILETPLEMEAVEELQRRTWPGSETDVVPAHLLLATVHNGGLVVGAYAAPAERPFSVHSDMGTQSILETVWEAGLVTGLSLVGFVFGFPGFYTTPDGPRLKHCSHMLGVHPDFRDQGLGFALKRAQWQMVRHQGVDRITWTYDPLLSRNAFLNIARLGAVCNTYLPNEYGDMRDDLNSGLPSDRFQVDWWVNTQRVVRRLSKKPRPRLDLAYCLAAGAEVINPSQLGAQALPHPANPPLSHALGEGGQGGKGAILLLEIPSDFQALRDADPPLALEWRRQARALFEELFQRGYLATDFVYLPGSSPRSFYVLSNGESTL
jgi:predicted GNAT superfamily acetyltransferase